MPMIGHSYLLAPYPLKVLDEHQKKYGDMFRLDLNKFPTVFMCNYKLAKEGMTNVSSMLIARKIYVL